MLVYQNGSTGSSGFLTAYDALYYSFVIFYCSQAEGYNETRKDEGQFSSLVMVSLNVLGGSKILLF